jgi:SAM-dependent methyltransferase
MGVFQKWHGRAHDKAVFKRRIDVLARTLAEFLPQGAVVLDIGCGSGTLAKAIMALRPDVTIEGIDVLVRPQTEIPVQPFDGHTIPARDNQFDVALIVDVLHHTDDPTRIMAEAKRVSKRGIIIKDHFRDGLFANSTLRFMDWFGNAAHGVRLPYNYLSRADWRQAWSKLGLNAERTVERMGLYPRPFTWLFDRNLHFVAHLS